MNSKTWSMLPCLKPGLKRFKKLHDCWLWCRNTCKKHPTLNSRVWIPQIYCGFPAQPWARPFTFKVTDFLSKRHKAFAEAASMFGEERSQDIQIVAHPLNVSTSVSVVHLCQGLSSCPWIFSVFPSYNFFLLPINVFTLQQNKGIESNTQFKMKSLAARSAITLFSEVLH